MTAIYRPKLNSNVLIFFLFRSIVIIGWSHLILISEVDKASLNNLLTELFWNPKENGGGEIYAQELQLPVGIE
jgi:hypothetical protein